MTRLSRRNCTATKRGFAAAITIGLTLGTGATAGAANDENAPIQVPEALGGADAKPEAAPKPAAPADAAAPTDGPAAGGPAASDAPTDPPPDDLAAVPSPATDETPAPDAAALSENPDPGSAPSDRPADRPASTPPRGSEPAIAPSLLAGDEEESPTPPRPGPTRTQVEDDAAYDAAVRAAYNAQYRPPSNPGKLNITVRALFANAGGGEKVGGRMAGMQADVGQSWNRFGYALTGSFWGGRVYLKDRVAEMNALIGLGPTLNLGRLALVGKGFLDLRAGYDIYYGVVNQQRGGATVVAPQGGEGDVSLVQTENLFPHGPRAQLNLGLLGGNNYRKRFHGFGVSMGYQGLVGSLRGELPFTHMLTVGLSYWMG